MLYSTQNLLFFQNSVHVSTLFKVIWKKVFIVYLCAGQYAELWTSSYCIIATSSWETVSICIWFPSIYNKYTIFDIDYDYDECFTMYLMYFLDQEYQFRKHKGRTLYEFNANDH